MKTSIAVLLLVLAPVVAAEEAADRAYVTNGFHRIVKMKNSDLSFEKLNIWINGYTDWVAGCVSEEKEHGIQIWVDTFCSEFIGDTDLKAADARMMKYYDYIKSDSKQMIQWLYLGDTQQMINYKIMKESLNIRLETVIPQICSMPGYENAEFC